MSVTYQLCVTCRKDELDGRPRRFPLTLSYETEEEARKDLHLLTLHVVNPSRVLPPPGSSREMLVNLLTRVGEMVGFLTDIVSVDGLQKVTVEPLPLTSEAQALESKFAELASRWLAETLVVSSAQTIYLNPNYQRIIGLGPPAVPLILNALRARTGHWHWALTSITGENPVPDSARGSYEAVVSAWDIWGQARGM